MFVTLRILQAKAGEEDAIIALHEDWQRNQKTSVEVAFFCWELLRNIKAPREFITIVQFENEELARAMAKDLEQDAWFVRLRSLLEAEPVEMVCSNEWRICSNAKE
jgi:hypothetical protein